jgi:hypothetical protein
MKMTYKIKNKIEKERTNGNSFVIDDKKYTSQLEEVYSFSKTDNDLETRELTPDEFLYETYQEGNISLIKSDKKSPFINFEDYKKKVLFKENIDGIKDVLLGKKKSKYRLPKPFLEYDNQGNPIGHEGKHTAQALKELGVKKFPVTIVKRK